MNFFVDAGRCEEGCSHIFNLANVASVEYEEHKEEMYVTVCTTDGKRFVFEGLPAVMLLSWFQNNMGIVDVQEVFANVSA